MASNTLKLGPPPSLEITVATDVYFWITENLQGEKDAQLSQGGKRSHLIRSQIRSSTISTGNRGRSKPNRCSQCCRRCRHHPPFCLVLLLLKRLKDTDQLQLPNSKTHSRRNGGAVQLTHKSRHCHSTEWQSYYNYWNRMFPVHHLFLPFIGGTE